jgi:hypothetical protein
MLISKNKGPGIPDKEYRPFMCLSSVFMYFNVTTALTWTVEFTDALPASEQQLAILYDHALGSTGGDRLQMKC